MPSKQLYLLFLSAVLLLSTGCSVIKQQLRPLVCECAAAAPPEAPSSDIATEVAVHQVEQAHAAAGEEALLEDDGGEQGGGREEMDQKKIAFEGDLIDPVLKEGIIPLGSDEERAAFQEEFRLSLPANSQALALRGTFRPNEPSSVAIYLPGESLTIYSNGQPLASLRMDSYETELDLEGLSIEPAQALELVRDGVTDIQLIQARAEDDGLTYYIGIYRIIGTFIGTIFHHPIAHRDKSGELRQLGDLRVLRGRGSRVIQWVPLDESGQIDGEPVEYEWNKWEGVYRKPGLPPTAPQRERADS